LIDATDLLREPGLSLVVGSRLHYYRHPKGRPLGWAVSVDVDRTSQPELERLAKRIRRSLVPKSKVHYSDPHLHDLPLWVIGRSGMFELPVRQAVVKPKGQSVADRKHALATYAHREIGGRRPSISGSDAKGYKLRVRVTYRGRTIDELVPLSDLDQGGRADIDRAVGLVRGWKASMDEYDARKKGSRAGRSTRTPFVERVLVEIDPKLERLYPEQLSAGPSLPDTNAAWAKKVIRDSLPGFDRSFIPTVMRGGNFAVRALRAPQTMPVEKIVDLARMVEHRGRGIIADDRNGWTDPLPEQQAKKLSSTASGKLRYRLETFDHEAFWAGVLSACEQYDMDWRNWMMDRFDEHGDDGEPNPWRETIEMTMFWACKRAK